MSDLYNVLVIVSYGNSPKDVSALLDGLQSLAKAVQHGQIPRKILAAQKSIPGLPPAPEMALTPRKAAQSHWDRIRLGESVGRISAEVVTCYPPGIPILYPGEVISQDVVDYLSIIRRLAFGISGPEDRTLTTLRVVNEM